MSYYYDEEFYNEPSEFDILVDEFKESLSKSVKEKYISEMERLRKENAELQDIKVNFEKVKRDFSNKKHELEMEYDQLKGNVRREHLSQLMKDFEVELYTVASRNKSKPKCDKCNENRRIPYTTPLGKQTYETCDCDTKIQIYEPIPILLSSFSIRNGEGHAWYKIKTDRNDEWLSYHEDSISGKELITDESQFEKISWAYRSLFKTKELAQKFCDYKNSKN